MLLLLAAEIDLARPAKHSLPQQTLMELSISHLSDHNQSPFKDSNGHFRPIDEWYGLKFHPNGTVRAISWGCTNAEVNINKEGSFLLEWVPDSVVDMNISDCGFAGKFDGRALPVHLMWLTALGNRLIGVFDMAVLPRCMVHINMDMNTVSGGVNLKDALPDFRSLCLKRNALDGSVVTWKSHLNFNSILLQKNRLIGSLDCTNFPENLEEFDVHQNTLTGSVDLTALPRKMRIIDLSCNRFDGTLDLLHLPPQLEILGLQENAFFGHADFSHRPGSLDHIDVSFTNLEGEIVVYGEEIEYGYFPVGGSNVDICVREELEE